MKVVKSMIVVAFIAHASVPKTIPDLPLPRESILQIPLPRRRPVQMLERCRYLIQGLHTNQEVIVVCQDNPAADLDTSIGHLPEKLILEGCQTIRR
jgi:hypothetical protein